MSKPRYAVQLHDSLHAVEMGLYPLPATAEALGTLLATLEKVPHTPEETQAVKALLAREAKQFLPEADYTQVFGDLEPAPEAEGAVTIALTAENYGLVYPAVQFAAESLGVSEPEDRQEAARTRLAELIDCRLKQQVEAAVTEVKDAVAALATRIETLTPQVTLTPEQIESLGQSLKPEAPLQEQLQALEARLAASQTQVKEALVELVSHYMIQLRKPLSRGKSREELQSTLGERTLPSLQDTLQDLYAEYDAGGTSGKELPLLDDPTQVTTPVETAESQHITDTQPDDLKAGELPLEEGEEQDIIQILFPTLR